MIRMPIGRDWRRSGTLPRLGRKGWAEHPPGKCGTEHHEQRRSNAVNITRALYRAARISNNISAIASGNPRRMARRAKNITVGRALRRGGVWRRLWK